MKKKAIYRSSIRKKKTPLRQGEILTNVFQYYPTASKFYPDEELSLDRKTHPYVIVITQDCDLDWDYKARNDDNKPDKLLNSIILCEITTAQEIKNITNSKDWSYVKSQRNERYHFFEEIHKDCDLAKEGMPELTADFKKIFGIESENLYRQLEIGISKRRTLLLSPYLEHFSRRYHTFHGRVALPHQYESIKEG